MLSLRTIEPHTLELLRHLCRLPELEGTRLVGGTALALQYGHRISVDLDFFGSFDKDLDFEALCRQVGKTEMLSQSKIIKVLKIDGIKVDFVEYSNHPWIDEPIIEDGIRMASPHDIAAMKVLAIDGRGTRKDFVDMYYLLQHFTMPEILQLYEQKFPAASRFRAMMCMTYFVDAEKAEMPRMLIDNVSWEDMKEHIRQETFKLR